MVHLLTPFLQLRVKNRHACSIGKGSSRFTKSFISLLNNKKLSSSVKCNLEFQSMLLTCYYYRLRDIHDSLQAFRGGHCDIKSPLTHTYLDTSST